MFEAYKRIFAPRRQFRPVEADSGAIGGSFTHEFHVLAGSGEDAILSCSVLRVHVQRGEDRSAAIALPCASAVRALLRPPLPYARHRGDGRAGAKRFATRSTMAFRSTTRRSFICSVASKGGLVGRRIVCSGPRKPMLSQSRPVWRARRCGLAPFADARSVPVPRQGCRPVN